MTSLLKFSALALIVSVSVSHAAPANIEGDKKAVGTSCKSDAEKIGCKMAMGNGMGKCMFEYKKLHQNWSPSAACKAALKKMRQDNMANRGGGGGGNGPGLNGQGTPPGKPASAPAPAAKPAGK
jgi:hypothetical protein